MVGFVCQVCLEVAPEPGGQGVGTATLGALEGLFPECRRSWARRVCGSWRAFLHTGHRPVGLPCVRDEVPPKLGEMWEGISAAWAAVGPFSRVQPQVATQAAPLAEGTAAVWAQERLLASVQPHVVP